MESTYNIYDLSDDDSSMYFTSDDSTTMNDSPSETARDNVYDLSCYICEVLSDNPRILCDEPSKLSTRAAPHRPRAATIRKIQNKKQLKKNSIGNSPNDPIIIPDQSTTKSSSNRENVPSTSESISERTSIDAQACPLCLETFKYIRSQNIGFMATSCGHIFCEMCLARCPSLNYRCPVCCNPVRPEEFIHLFM